ncbi:glycosyltransferase family 9 protein [Granulicella tundricola]|uniref:Glycosyl transferase family 9 n=1 Tax=Granulicella tundricola (strain ATCC BAA-1859 / DSM 23138 / MP5ACTX9) TaxID=1198114 RepID=E8WXX6_GRATM|nr:glycosyltransferase family 9 protein [Granulicella tundricola]ADW67515.1 glycosyl transferase family 9 [Granulicella tundricola MP5ACTX9]
MPQPSVLILKFGAIGDVIMAIPAAHALHLQGFRIDWICSPTVAPILALYPWINPILIDDRALLKGSPLAKLKVIAKMWRTLAGRHYDLVANLYYDPRYRILTLPVRATRRLMLSTTDRRFQLLPGRHHTDEYARILLNLPDHVRPTQLAPIPAPNLPPSPHPRTPGHARVILAPAGARNLLRDDLLRRWPPELYVELTRQLLAQNIEVVLIGGPDDAWITESFASLQVTNLIGKLKLPETLALLDDSDVMVTHDTGPLHLAGITRVAIVTLFGPTDPHGRLPQRPGTLALWGGEHFACRPCYDGRDFAPCPSNDCMRQITPTAVTHQILQLLQTQPNKPSLFSSVPSVIRFPPYAQ